MDAPGSTLRRGVRAIAAMLLAPALLADAGVVWTAGGRRVGDVAIRDGKLNVGGKDVAADEALVVVLEPPGHTLPQPNAVRLTGGELWRCEILSLTAGKLTLRSDIFGTREIDSSAVAALEFRADLPEAEGLDTRCLYRGESQPLPGELLWISRERIAVDSPLGALAVDRDGAARFLLRPAPRPAAPGADEVALVDGSVLHGKAGFAKDAVLLTHEMIGELRLPVAAVRAVTRRADGVTHLAALKLSPSAEPLLGSGPAGKAIEAVPPGRQPPGAACARSLTIRPTAEVALRLASAATFRATASPVAGARAPAVLEIAGGGKTLVSKPIAPGDEPAEVSADAPAGRLVIRVRFADAEAFPCGVTLGDPHVLAK